METTNCELTCLKCEELARLFHRAAKMMARTYHRHSHAHHAQAHVYSILKKHGSMSQADLLQLLDVRSSSLSEVLGKLEQGGLITRERSEQDRRSFVITVNEGATPPFQLHSESHEKSADALFACLDEQERNQLGSLLQKVIDSVSSRGGDGVDTDHHKHQGHAKEVHGSRGVKKKTQRKGKLSESDDAVETTGRGRMRGKDKRGKK